MTIPKCTSWRGHKFEGRYSLSPARKLGDKEVFWAFDVAEALQSTQARTYERDICIRCGHVIPK